MSNSSTNESLNDLQRFWNRKAKTFPRYDPSEASYEAGVLALAKAKGAVWRDLVVLDVGCGTGIYALRLAQEAKSVVGVDLSPGMLAVLKEDALSLGLNNLTIIESDWLGAPLEGPFDLVFCSMCPALSQEGGLDKVLAQKKAQVVYLGWNGLYRSMVLEECYAQYQIPPKALDAAPKTRAFLTERGIAFEAYPVEGTWRVRYSLELLLDSVLQNLSSCGVEPDPEEIKVKLARFREADGQYLEEADYKIQLLLWRNP
ncbi:MAG: class I SAM-dependent methyltransferase [Deltaproteobacteria bacterium]|nr:class I SAM-dependent methyltransferase [Deltaproteobacteria bacterium]